MFSELNHTLSGNVSREMFNNTNHCIFCGQWNQWSVSQPPKQIMPAFDPPRIPSSLLETMLTFFKLQDVNALAQANKAWRKRVTFDTTKYSYIDRKCSFLVSCCVQNALGNSEANPMTSPGILWLAKIERLLDIKILPFSNIRHLLLPGNHNSSLLMLQKLSQSANPVLSVAKIQSHLHRPNPYREALEEFAIPVLELSNYKQAIEVQIEGHGLAQLKNFTALRSLNTDTYLAGGEFARVACLAGILESLNITNITDIELQTLTQFTALKKLRLHSGNITDGGLSTLSSLITLQILSFQHCKITGAGLKALSQLTELQELNFKFCAYINTANVAQLADITALKSLSFVCASDSQIRNIEKLELFASLRSLTLDTCRNIRDDQLIPLTKLNNLQILNLSCCEQISGQGLIQLIGLTTLRELDISFTKIDQENLTSFLIHCPVHTLRMIGCPGIEHS